jgi:phosphoglycolate phosphatase
MSYRYILFDLDGTLTDPKPGITRSARHALARLGIAAPGLDELEHFIGPPLKDTFRDRYGLSPEQAQRAIAYYREYFAARGIYENALYPGIGDLLARLKRHGKALALATTKPTVFANEVLRHFNIESYFDAVAGGSLDDSLSDKGDIVRQALRALARPDPRETVMVGDTEYDRLGAERNGIAFIGVRYGYGFREGAGDARPRGYPLVSGIEELQRVLLA